ncbi:hypothetical protein L1987_19421 [Smallanthus sonchifolius]|uniref:Uncharacterized protein n=1 Tax=Smallanthus sonchifolius TaxID=185202 RepID=A0ACB9IQS3_9ASTR|nr:hypothetical protein L1987_19421 [Smallanthus sonchifolius]
METLQDLIKEAKLRTVWWTVAKRSSEVEFHWKGRKPNRQSYLSYLERKQLSVNDSRVSILPPQRKWKRKIDSPVVEAALEDFVKKVLQEFVMDLWYSDITPDKEAPQLIHAIIMDVLAEISIRVRDMNLVDLLTRDVVDLVGDHLELFRKNQAVIGREVMVTLSSEERDEILKHHLMASKELHPALISSEILRPREAQCPLVRCIVRELLTCLVMEPVMRFASPGHINELIEGLNPPGSVQDEMLLNPQSFAWARGLEAATQRRTEVLQPENLENMWTKGRNYKKKSQKQIEGSGINENDQQQILDGRILSDQSKVSDPSYLIDGNNSNVVIGSKTNLERSSNFSDQNQAGGAIISEFYSANVGGDNDVHNVNNIGSHKVTRTEGYVPKLRCRVLGAYYENLDSKSFAVYSIAVTDADNKRWNFERLHRHLKDIPNYTLHLPPKRIFSSSTEDAFVHQRCIQLDKYLQDLLSIANIAEQHEVWDFLSLSSKSYSFGRSSSMVRALAVNVDDAVDDIVRQFKRSSDGLKKKVASPGLSSEPSASVTNRNVSLKADDPTDSGTKLTDGTVNQEEVGPATQSNERNLEKSDEQNRITSEVRSEILSLAANITSTSGLKEDPLGVPAEWTPTNVSVPLLNLVDKIFQLNRRGWLRRQVFWISKQILQLMMEDAIDDWLLRQIHWLRRENMVAQGIHWIQDVLWPEGTFFLKLRPSQTDSSQSNESSCKTPSGSKNNKGSSFEEQLEAARRASDIKKMILDGAPTTLVSLIGHKQYKRSAKDIYYFLQSAVCLKQLGYGLLELALVTIFPELQDIISNIHEKKKDPTV